MTSDLGRLLKYFSAAIFLKCCEARGLGTKPNLPAFIDTANTEQFVSWFTKWRSILTLATYIEICYTVKLGGVPEDAIRLSLFSFSLSGEAKRWLHSFKGNSLKT